MPKRTAKPRRQYGPTYLRAWRKSAGLSMDALLNRLAEAGMADLEGLSKSSLSRIETGKQPYNQAILEAIAHALDCSPADLLATDPDAPARSFHETIRTLPPDAIEQLAAIAKTFQKHNA